MAKRTLGFMFIILAMAAGFVIYSVCDRAFYRAAYPLRYSDGVEGHSEINGLSPSLVYAVIWTESGFNPNAQSSVGARGLMQITEETLDWTAYRLGEEQPEYEVLFDGDANIKYGSALLRLLSEEFGSTENALCAYHAGYGNVKKWLDDPEYSPDGKNIENIPFGDTRLYVKRVLDTRAVYRRLYGIK